jgi:hypothetical protein
MRGPNSRKQPGGGPPHDRQLQGDDPDFAGALFHLRSKTSPGTQPTADDCCYHARRCSVAITMYDAGSTTDHSTSASDSIADNLRSIAVWP